MRETIKGRALDDKLRQEAQRLCGLTRPFGHIGDQANNYACVVCGYRPRKWHSSYGGGPRFWLWTPAGRQAWREKSRRLAAKLQQRRYRDLADFLNLNLTEG
jgi:hypothetical protein